MIDVSVIIVNYNTKHLIERNVSTLREAAGSLRLQICIVDNASRDSSAEYIKERFPDCEFQENRMNVGFGRANNQIVSNTTGRYILLLNTDAFLSKDSLSKSLSYMQSHPDCGVLGAKLTDEDGGLQPSCRYFPTPWNVFLSRSGLERFFPVVQMIDEFGWNHDSARECDWVPGCYYLIRRECFEQVGLFDPLFFLYYEEVDHCRAAKAAGWKVVFFPDAVVIHLGGESAKSDANLTASGRQISELQIESELLYFRKHYGFRGVLASVFLSGLAAMIMGAKSVISKGKGQKISTLITEIRLRLYIFRATSWATRATR